MSKNKITIQTDLERLIKNLENAGANVNKSIEELEKASKKVVTDNLIKDTIKANYPAHGRYSAGELAKSIDQDYNVKWTSNVAEISVGYNMKKSGLTSIMLLYGTPRMKKSTKLYNDIYGKKTRDKIAEIQQETLNKILERAATNGR